MTGNSGKPLGAGVKIVRKRLADGTVKEYRYPKGQRTRIRTVHKHGAIRQIAELYVKSPEFGGLSQTWQSAKRYYLGILEDKLGWITTADLNRREVRREFYELRDGVADTPDKADKLVSTLKSLLAWAYERNMIDWNHAHGIHTLAPAAGRRNDNIWTEDHQAIYHAAAPEWLSRAFRVALYSAARQSDMCAFSKDQYRDGWLTFQPSKTETATGVTVFLPVYLLPPFRDLLDELVKGPGEFLLTGGSGNPLTAANLRSQHRRLMARTELAREDLHWHDIRGTAVTTFFDAGCTEAETASITGHAIAGRGSLDFYAARTKQLAINAYSKLQHYLAAKPQIVMLKPTGKP